MDVEIVTLTEKLQRDMAEVKQLETGDISMTFTRYFSESVFAFRFLNWKQF